MHRFANDLYQKSEALLLPWTAKGPLSPVNSPELHGAQKRHEVGLREAVEGVGVRTGGRVASADGSWDYG